jgi:para-nitrobenzyl esterase
MAGLVGAPLREVSAEQLVTAASKVGAAAFHPFIDGDVLPAHPLTALGDAVDLLIGACAREADRFARVLPTFVPGILARTRQIAGPDAWARLQQAYTETDLAGAAFTQMPCTWLAEHAARAGARVWQYRFDYADAGRWGAVHGVRHRPAPHRWNRSGGRLGRESHPPASDGVLRAI